MLSFKQFLREYLSDDEKASISHWERPDSVSAYTDHFFGKGNDEVEVPLSLPKSEIHKEVENHLGQEISKEDYNKGMINNRIRIQSSISDPELQKRYKSDSTRNMKSNNETVLITRSKHGIAGQTSTGQSWIDHSCKRFGAGIINNVPGVNSHYLEPEYESGTVVAYHKDKDGKEISRTTLHPYHNGDKVVYRANGNYGNRSPAFSTFVKNLELHLSHPYDEKDSGREYTIHPDVYNDNAFIAPGAGSSVTLHPQDLINNRDKFAKNLEDKINTSYNLADIAHGYLNGYLTPPTLNAIHKKIGEEFSSFNLSNILKYHKMGLITKDHRKILADGLQKKLDDKTLTSTDILNAQKYGYFASHLHAPIKNYMIDKFSRGDIDEHDDGEEHHDRDDHIYISQLNSPEDKKLLHDKISEKLLNGDTVNIKNLYYNGLLSSEHVKDYLNGFPKKLSSGNFTSSDIFLDAMNGIHDYKTYGENQIIPPHWNNSMLDYARKGLGKAMLNSKSIQEILDHQEGAKELGFYVPDEHDHYLDQAISRSSFSPNDNFRTEDENRINELLKNGSIGMSSVHDAISNYLKNTHIEDFHYMHEKDLDLSHPFFSKEIHKPILQKQIRSALERGDYSEFSIDKLIKNGYFGNQEKIAAAKGLVHKIPSYSTNIINHAIENGYFDPKLHLPVIKSNMKNYNLPEDFSYAYELLKNSPNFKQDISNIAAERLKNLSVFDYNPHVDRIIHAIDHATKNNYMTEDLRDIAKTKINDIFKHVNTSTVGHIINNKFLAHAKTNNYIDKKSLIESISKNPNYELSPYLLSVAKDYGGLHEDDGNTLLHTMLKNHIINKPNIVINPTYIREAREKGFWSDELKELTKDSFNSEIKRASLGNDRYLNTLINDAKNNGYFNQKEFADAVRHNIKRYDTSTSWDNKDNLKFIAKHHLYEPSYNNIISSALKYGDIDIGEILNLSQSPHLHKLIHDHVAEETDENKFRENMEDIEPLLKSYGIRMRNSRWDPLREVSTESMRNHLAQLNSKISSRMVEPKSGIKKKKIISKDYLERPFPRITARQKRFGIQEEKPY